MPTFLSAVLDTSCFVPAEHRDLVPRHHLLDALHQHRHTNIRALLAPIGSGKTTLLQQYYSRNPSNCAWLSLAEEDTSANGFFHHLVSAVQRVIPDFNGPVLCHEFGDEEQEPHVFLDLFLQALTRLDHPITIIVDDLQLISGLPWYQRFIELMLNASNVHWMVAASTYSALFKDIQVDADCYLITQDQLYFNAKEQRVFLSKNAAHQAFNQIISQVTHGWPAGVKLAQLCLTKATASGVDLNLPTRALFDHLVDTLIHYYDELTPGFLTQTAFLHRFNTALCQSYVRAPELPRSLDTVLSSLFLLQVTPEHPLCYQYNPLIKQRLLHRFQMLPHTERERLVSGACTWLTENGFNNDGMITAAHHPHPAIQDEYYRKNLVHWLRSGNLAALNQNQTSHSKPSLKTLPQAKLAWCWLMNMSGRLLQSDAILQELLQDKPIAQVLQQPQNGAEANCAVAYGAIRSQQCRLDDDLVENLKQLTKHNAVYTSLRATLNSLLADIELQRLHSQEAEAYIAGACAISDELGYEYNFCMARQIAIRLHFFNNDPAHALAEAQQVLSRHWRYPNAVGVSLLRVTLAHLLYRADTRGAGYELGLAQCNINLTWMPADTQFMVYQMIIREIIRQGDTALAKSLLAFLHGIACSNGAERFNAQLHLEHFRLAVMVNDGRMSEELATHSNLLERVNLCLREDCHYDWISRFSWLTCGIYYHRNKHDLDRAQELNQQLLYLTVQNGFPVHFLTLSVMGIWLEFSAGNHTAAYIKLNELLHKTSPDELQSGLFDDIPGCDTLINRALAEQRIELQAHRSALIKLGFGEGGEQP